MATKKRGGRGGEALIDWDHHIRSAPWTREAAPMVLTLLMERLKNHAGPISYGELAQQLWDRYGLPVQPNKQKYGLPLGAAADVAIAEGSERGIKVPPISLIVVNANSGYPGSGADQFVPKLRGKRLDSHSPQRRRILDEEITRLRAFGRPFWERLEQALRLSPAPQPAFDLTDIGPPPEPRAGGQGEGPAHAAVKRWVVAHPDHFTDFGHFDSGTCEARLQSGDSVDAMLVGPTARLAIEVKDSRASADELVRGIFQCVKYRATLQAEAAVYPNHRLPGDAVLVSPRRSLPQRAASTAAALAVRFVPVPIAVEGKR